MNDRERFLACMTGQPVDRPPFWLAWGPWGTTAKRWAGEAKPGQPADFGAIRKHYGVDQPPMTLPVNLGPCPGLGRKVIQETSEFVIFTDGWGIKRRDFRGHTAMSEFIEFPVKSWDDWRRFQRDLLNPDDPRRLSGDWRKKADDAIARGQPIRLGDYPNCGVFGCVRWLLGDEECLISFCTEPKLIHEIMDHMTALYLTVFEKVCREVRVDTIHIWEDMCGRQGPLISPAMFDEFMAPCYRRIKRFADDHGIQVISVDTDGQPDLIIPPMMKAGVNWLFPFEVAAGCDVNDFGRRYPTLGMMGGVDKRALAKDPAAIDAELARIRPAVARGRYVPDLDHLIPDDVSLDNYCYYAGKLRELVYSVS